MKAIIVCINLIVVITLILAPQNDAEIDPESIAGVWLFDVEAGEPCLRGQPHFGPKPLRPGAPRSSKPDRKRQVYLLPPFESSNNIPGKPLLPFIGAPKTFDSDHGHRIRPRQGPASKLMEDETQDS